MVFPSSCKILKIAKYIDSFETAAKLNMMKQGQVSQSIGGIVCIACKCSQCLRVPLLPKTKHILSVLLNSFYGLFTVDCYPGPALSLPLHNGTVSKYGIDVILHRLVVLSGAECNTRVVNLAHVV